MIFGFMSPHPGSSRLLVLSSAGDLKRANSSGSVPRGHASLQRKTLDKSPADEGDSPSRQSHLFDSLPSSSYAEAVAILRDELEVIDDEIETTNRKARKNGCVSWLLVGSWVSR